jgi:hypothetical protein
MLNARSCVVNVLTDVAVNTNAANDVPNLKQSRHKPVPDIIRSVTSGVSASVNLCDRVPTWRHSWANDNEHTVGDVAERRVADALFHQRLHARHSGTGRARHLHRASTK